MVFRVALNCGHLMGSSLLVPLGGLGAEYLIARPAVKPDRSVIGVLNGEDGSVAAMIADPLFSVGG